MKSWNAIWLITLITAGCRKPYNPPVISVPVNYLVVEGVVNPGADSTIIKISRTVKLNARSTTNPEKSAFVSIESNTNVSYPLTEIKTGYYAAAALNLDTALKYRLNIKTVNNQQYQSDFVPVKITPPIDSVGFNFLGGAEPGIQIYANTRDPKNNTRYYRWDYDETWQFHAKYLSRAISNGATMIERTQAQNIYYCFANDVSSSIVLGSSAKLQQDVMYQAPIVTIAATSEKIEAKYSILLREYALTADAYTFYENLKKNTEQLGSIFDALPSQINGNIHCINDPSQTVIGYVSVCNVQSKRIFISHDTQLPDSWQPKYPFDCEADTVKVGTDNYRNSILLNPDVDIAIDPIPDFLNPVDFTFTNRECADCTVRGSKTQPAFWR